MSGDLKQKVMRGAGWMAINQVVRQVLGLVTMAILGRLLLPADFGLFFMALVLIGILELFQEFGLGAAVIQRKEVTEEQICTVFALNVIFGASLALITALLSPAVAAFYQRPELVGITILSGLTFFITSFMAIHGALLTRRMDFRTPAIVSIIATVVSSVVVVVLAYRGWGVYALVFQSIVRETLSVILTWILVGWYPRVRPRFASVRELTRFGANMTGINVLSYIHRNLDSLLVGKFVGARELGIYTMAHSVMLMPIRRVVVVLSNVAFPAFSSVQQDRARMGRGYLQMVSLIALVTFPMMMGILIVAPEAVRALLGRNWDQAAFLIRVLTFVGMLQSISAMSGSIFKATGHVHLMLRLQILSTTVVAASFAVGLFWSIEGVAVAYTLSQFILVPIVFHFSLDLVGLTLRDLYRTVRAPLWAGLIMMAAVLGFRFLSIEVEKAMQVRKFCHVLLLCTEIPVGMIAYALALRAMSPTVYQQLLDLAKLARGRRQPAPEPPAETPTPLQAEVQEGKA